MTRRPTDYEAVWRNRRAAIYGSPTVGELCRAHPGGRAAWRAIGQGAKAYTLSGLTEFDPQEVHRRDLGGENSKPSESRRVHMRKGAPNGAPPLRAATSLTLSEARAASSQILEGRYQEASRRPVPALPPGSSKLKSAIHRRSLLAPPHQSGSDPVERSNCMCPKPVPPRIQAPRMWSQSARHSIA